MKKISILLPACIVAASLYADAQTKKQPLPPPKVNIIKFKPPKLKESGKETNEFYKQNPSVATIQWGAKEKVFIRLKNGNKEEYDFTKENQKKTFTEKYGKAPTPPPPPPAKPNQ